MLCIDLIYIRAWFELKLLTWMNCLCWSCLLIIRKLVNEHNRIIDCDLNKNCKLNFELQYNFIFIFLFYFLRFFWNKYYLLKWSQNVFSTIGKLKWSYLRKLYHRNIILDYISDVETQHDCVVLKKVKPISVKDGKRMKLKSPSFYLLVR